MPRTLRTEDELNRGIVELGDQFKYLALLSVMGATLDMSEGPEKGFQRPVQEMFLLTARSFVEFLYNQPRTVNQMYAIDWVPTWNAKELPQELAKLKHSVYGILSEDVAHLSWSSIQRLPDQYSGITESVVADALILIGEALGTFGDQLDPGFASILQQKIDEATTLLQGHRPAIEQRRVRKAQDDL